MKMEDTSWHCHSNPTRVRQENRQAFHRFSALERRLNADPTLGTAYQDTMNEYIELGHMTKIDADNKANEFYLPHHPVIKQSSQTTKVRVVFDGSAKSSTGTSLNETLIVGSTIQDDIVSLILRFRLHVIYVMTGDIEKMYRQFLVRNQDRIYQKIIWRNEEGILNTYKLNTVIFGLSAAPFLAIRCLRQLADEEALHFPAASETLKRDL